MERKRWEIKRTMDWEEAERLAYEGWELVGAVPVLFIHGIGDKSYIFKRELK